MAAGSISIAAVVQDYRMLEAERESIALGRFDEAAERALRIVVLKRQIRAQLRAQIPTVVALGRRFPREEPLLRALHRLDPDASWDLRLGRLRALTARVADIRLAGLRYTQPDRSSPPPARPHYPRSHIVPPGSSYALFRYQRNEQLPHAENTYQLSRISPAGRREPLGTGWSSVLGQSWALHKGGTVVALARPDERTIELWDLTTANTRWQTTPGTPVYVALGGDGANLAVAFSSYAQGASRDHQRLDIWDGKSVWPVNLSHISDRGHLAFDWDPTADSLVVVGALTGENALSATVPGVWVNRRGQPLVHFEMRRNELSRLPWWVRGPGDTKGLSIGHSAWIWDGHSSYARLLPETSGQWAFSPDGKLMAGLHAHRLFVADREDPRVRQYFSLPGVPKNFQPAPGGIDWDADGLRISGWAKAPGRKGLEPARLEADLIASQDAPGGPD
ncbi:MAG: hypothetical protein VKN33_00195 [Candidatus Sericytochromatia bacterium]|nr:hypothetical protein [Candidatus Sericytochromatia bacterium]